MANIVVPKLSFGTSGINFKTYKYGGSLKTSQTSNYVNNYEEIDYSYVP